MNTLEKIGKFIKALRTKKGLSQEMLCSQCGIDQHYISNIEKGYRNLSVEIVERVASFFGLSLSQFFAGVEAYEVLINDDGKCKGLSTVSSLDGFVKYMENQRLSERTIKKYSSDTPNSQSVRDIIREVSGITDDMYHIRDLAKLDRIIERVSNSEFNRIGHSMYSAGLKKYRSYIESLL